MIPGIKELNWPEYATLSSATAALADMGERTITATVKIDGDVTPDFSREWAVEYRGEKYIMPLRKPAGAKENTSTSATVELTFRHWAEYQLKRWLFFTVQTVDSSTAVADQYEASVSLHLGDFCTLLGQVLEYYYGDTITVDLNPAWNYDNEPTTVGISHSYIWDVLTQLWELYAVRWQIEPNGDSGHYKIKVGYDAGTLDHIFEYGYEGGLQKVERQMQSEEIRNMLLGRGGEQNLPLRYFKDVDADNAAFRADPDWVPELANVYFDRLRGATFRSYVQGWKSKHYPSGYSAPQSAAYAPWAWEKGYTDAKFDPVEYVADELIETGRTETDAEGNTVATPTVAVELSPTYTPNVRKASSIDNYGPLLGGLEDNDDIYPTIQGVSVSPYGRIDQVVDVEQITSDTDTTATAAAAASLEIRTYPGGCCTIYPQREEVVEIKIRGATFTVDAGRSANLELRDQTASAKWVNTRFHGRRTIEATAQNMEIIDTWISVFNVDTGEERGGSGITEGTWYYMVHIKVQMKWADAPSYGYITLTASYGGVTRTDASVNSGIAGGDAFYIWVKDIWGSTKSDSETEAQYSSRVWEPILGDRTGEEAKVVFTSGALSVSEDYDFTILEYPVHDESRELDGVKSHWRIKLAKSDADLESLGKYVPNAQRNGAAGDYFCFIGTELTHNYVDWAERRLDDYKKDKLAEAKDIKPTWAVTTDRVRLNGGGASDALIAQIRPGQTVRLADPRFVDGAYEQLRVASLTLTFREPSSSDAALNPDLEMTLSDGYEGYGGGDPVAMLEGDVSAVAKQLGAIGNIEQVVRAVGDRTYLRKDGVSDRSLSPTEFHAIVKSGDFRSGIVGGEGWGMFRDENGAWVFETDRINVRKEIQVNSLVVNQAVARGGMEISTAAYMEAVNVFDLDDVYRCHFDQKDGSVVNMFRVGDVAYHQSWGYDNSSLKYYKRRVMAVGIDYIDLAKGYAAVTLADGTTDTGVDGSGVPETGDVIIHFGSYTDAERQYVKVRDVVGGGYERYLQGLDSVYAAGTEYLFSGRQSGQYGNRPRFYVGDAQGWIEWRDGRLCIMGGLTASTDGGSTSVDGGVVLSTLLRLGETETDGTRSILAGLNGATDAAKRGGGLAAFFGGDMVDAADDARNGAMAAIRMDGTAYFAGNTLRLKESEIEVGDYIHLFADGLHMIIDGEERVSMTMGDLPPANYAGEYSTLSLHSVYSDNSDYDITGPEDITGQGSTVTDGAFSAMRRHAEYDVDGITNNSLKVIVELMVPQNAATVDLSAINYYATLKDFSGNLILGSEVQQECYAKLERIDDNGIAVEQLGYADISSGDTKKIIPTAGLVRLTIWLHANTPNYSYFKGELYIGISATGQDGAITMRTSAEKLFIARDGLMATYNSNYLRFQSTDGFEARVGNYGLKLSSSGLKKMTDGGTWEDL